MSKNEVIQTAKAAAEIVLEFVKWYEKREQSLAYVKCEEPAANLAPQREIQSQETSQPISNVAKTTPVPAQELKQTEKPAKQTPQLQEGDYFLKKGTITKGVARIMRSFGWNRSFDAQGLNSFFRYHDIQNSFISDLLYEKEIKAGVLTSASAQSKLSQRLRGKRGFTQREMDFIELILPRAVKEYRCGESAHTQRSFQPKANAYDKRNLNVRNEPLLAKGEISSEMAELMKEHGWTGSFDCAGLKAFIKAKLPTMSTYAIAQLLFEDERKTGRISSKKSAATCLFNGIAGRRFFSVREMDRFVQILRELLPPVDDMPSSSRKPFVVWREEDDDSIRDGQNNVIAKNEDDFTAEKAEALEKVALGETGENGESVNAKELGNTNVQPDLKQGPGRGNWFRNTFRSLTAGF